MEPRQTTISGPANPESTGLFSTRGEIIASAISGTLLAVGLLLHNAQGQAWAESFIWASLAIGMLYGGRAAWEALRARKVDIDVLMIVGAGLAAYVGHPEEGALLLFLFVLSGAMESAAAARTSREIEALHKLMPDQAEVRRDGDWVIVAPTALVVGDVVRVKPGSRIPADAMVTTGSTDIDQSAMTGESMPRHVGPGDQIYSGTINLDDPVEARVTKPASESSLQRVLNLVTTAREQREPVQRIIDRFSEPYAVAVLAASAVVLVVWWQGLGRSWTDSAYTAITLLIVASPCALVIATPTATLAGIARAARQGVLFKGGQSIERLARVGAVCFDKTGTLTFGRPKLGQVHAVAWSSGKDLLAAAAGLEQASTHPIAAAVLEAAAARGIEPSRIDGLNHTTGRGMSGLAAGIEVRLGSYRHVEEIIPVCLRARTQEVLSKIQERGQIGVVIAQAQAPGESPDASGQAAVLVLSDQVRPGAAELVERLHAQGVRPVRMLTGDNRATADRVAASLGLDRVDAELMPQDKLRIVGEMKEEMRGKARPAVAVIGDGVNDAPALAAADVAVAIGSIGSDAALESADIVLLSDDLSVVPWAVGLSRRIRAVIRFNLAFAAGIIAVMIVATLALSLAGHEVPMSAGVIAHEGGTVLVVLNSLRLLLHPAAGDQGRQPRRRRVRAEPAPAPA